MSKKSSSVACPGNCAFWREREEAAQTVIQLNEEMENCDVDAARRERRWLGTAMMLSGDAIKLVLAGEEEYAKKYFAAVKALALAAYENNDGYNFKDPDGRNLFGKYTALELAAKGEWALGGPNRSSYLERAVGYLEENIRVDVKKQWPADVKHHPRLVGQVSMHLAQLGAWNGLRAWPVVPYNRSRPEAIWGQLRERVEAISSAVEAGTRVAVEKVREPFELWFRALVDHERLGEVHDLRLASGDIVNIAEIRAHWLYGVTDPWKTMRSIRWPDLVMEESQDL